MQIKNLLPVSEVVLQQELGDGRRNRAWYRVLLMKFCCDASAAGLNGGRFETSHIRLSVSELISTVISTPVCTHTRTRRTNSFSFQTIPQVVFQHSQDMPAVRESWVPATGWVRGPRQATDLPRPWTSPSCPGAGAGPAAPAHSRALTPGRSRPGAQRCPCGLHRAWPVAEAPTSDKLGLYLL